MITSPYKDLSHGEKAVGNMRLSKAYYTFAEDYIWLHGYTEKTALNYKYAITSLMKAIGDINLFQLDQEDIKEWRRYMDKHQYEVGAINAFLYRIRKILEFYEDKHQLKIKPSEIIIPKKNNPIPKFLTIEEVHLLIKHSDLREKAIFSLLYASGLRVGELVKLRRKDVYGDTIKVRGKGNRERIAFLDEASLKYLRDYLASRDDPCPFLFYSKKCNGLKIGRIQQLIRINALKAGINKTVSPHVLRHSFATHMVQNGIGAFHLQKLLGHADISTTQIYVHLGSADLRDAYSRFHHA